MIELIYGLDEQVARWVAAQMPGFEHGFAGNFAGAIGVYENGRVIGGTVFHNLYESTGVVEMTSAAISPRWLSPKMIRAIFDHAFDRLGCQLAVIRVSEHNVRMVSIAERFGFDGYLIPRLRGRDEAEWVFTLTDDQWAASPFNRNRESKEAG